MERHAYAEYQPYGLRTVSSDDCAICFASTDERDLFVVEANRRGRDRVGRNVAQAVTRDEARRVYRVEDITDACTRDNIDQLDNRGDSCTYGDRTAVAYRRYEVNQCWSCSDLH